MDLSSCFRACFLYVLVFPFIFFNKSLASYIKKTLVCAQHVIFEQMLVSNEVGLVNYYDIMLFFPLIRNRMQEILQ